MATNVIARKITADKVNADGEIVSSPLTNLLEMLQAGLDASETNLVLIVPWDSQPLEETLANCSREKKSVTLCNGTLVAEGGHRGSIDFYDEIGPYRLQIRGGVNLWASRPEDAGKGKSIVGGRDAAMVREARAEADASMVVLDKPLYNPDGVQVCAIGERLTAEALGIKLMAGWSLGTV